jgi:[ribosomal protein S5]-alanine N-acetyltransferase
MSELELIETDRLVLSGWRMDQVEDLVRLHGDPEISRYFTADGLPWTREKCAVRLAEWIEQFAQRRMGKLRVVRKSDGAMVGRAGFGLHGPTGEPEIGYALFPEFQGHGYAIEAASALRDWIFRDTKWGHFIGFADVRNGASLRILRRIGMTETHVGDFQGMTCQFHVLHKAAA